MRSSILFSLLLLFSQNSEACRLLNWSAEEYSLNSNLVYVGLVNAVQMPESKVPIDINTYVNSTLTLDDTDVVLKVIKSLKGKKEKFLKISLNWCRGGDYKLGDIVVAYKQGDLWHVKNTKPEIQQSIRTLTSSKTTASGSDAFTTRPF